MSPKLSEFEKSESPLCDRSITTSAPTIHWLPAGACRAHERLAQTTRLKQAKWRASSCWTGAGSGMAASIKHRTSKRPSRSSG